MKKGQICIIILTTIFVTLIVRELVVTFLGDIKEQTTVTTSKSDKGQDFVIPSESKAVNNLGYITVGWKKTELSGKQLQVGDILTDTQLDPKADYFDQVGKASINDFSGYRLIETVPSLDTPVCSMQTKQLEFAAEKYPDVTFIIVSNDTPFALQRFCAANKIDNLKVFSDARSREFGIKNALLMQEYGLLARAVMIVDEKNEIKYIEYANEVTDELDLMNALAKLHELTQEGK